jgi:hypothetical protein
MLSQKIIQPIPALRRDKVEISRLINSIFYFIDVVYILKKDDTFRLIALQGGQGGRVLIDKIYRTITGAKIAFTKFYQDKAWKEGVKAEWSHFYPPARPWLDEYMKTAEKAH